MVAIVDSTSHELLGPVALSSFKKYLGDDQVLAGLHCCCAA
jgi:hypothetical protein